MRPEKPHLHSLDFLRGAAALAVCLYHFTGELLPGLRLEAMKKMFSFGWLGVELFFVISGFVIPYVLMQSSYQLRDSGRFLLKRLIRIAPPAYLILLLTIAQCLIISGYVHAGSDWNIRLSGAAILHNFTFTIPFTQYRWINGIFWTLAIEWQFYLMMALVFPLLYRNILFFLGGALLLAAIYYLPFARHIGVLHYQSLFLTGGAALWYHEKKIAIGPYLLLLAACTILIGFQLGVPQAIAGGGTACAISFLKIRNRAGTFLGRISYSLYLIHILVGMDLGILLSRWVAQPSPLQKIILMGVCVCGTILCAWVYHRLAEAPFMRLASRIFRKPPQAAEPVLSSDGSRDLSGGEVKVRKDSRAT